MNKYFNKIKLGDLTKIIAGGDKPKIFSENKTSINTVPVFANAEGNNGLQGYTDIPRIIEPAVTISARGSKVGFAALRKEPFFPVVRLLTLIPEKDKLDVDYLFYNLKLNRQNGTGSGQPQITIPEISEKIISVPPLLTQQKIASVLSALDSKIELNNRINAELEAMAKTLYDYWFVQFDFPISAAQAASMGKPNLEGKPYKSSGGKMVWNEELKREIPEGWKVKRVEDVLLKESSKVKIPSSEFKAQGLIPIIDQSTDFISGYTDNKEAKIEGGQFPRIVFGDHTRILKLINFDFARGADGTQVLTSSSLRLPQHLFYHALHKIDLSNYGYARHFKFLKDSLVIEPDLISATQFERMATEQYKMIRENRFQNQQLASLRDWLLPMLMNGQVTVGGASKTYKMPEEHINIAAEE